MKLDFKEICVRMWTGLDSLGTSESIGGRFRT